MTCIFVYGTLRRGGSAEDKLQDVEWMGSAKFRGDLYQIDWYPGLVENSSGGEVKGDVFLVNQTILELLDEYEGCAKYSPEPHEYVRQECTVKMSDGSERLAHIWLYQAPVDESKKILHGDWLKHLAE